MKKLTKIIATIGPSSDSEEMIEKLILAGVNIFRFNFKHSDIAWHDERIKRVNKIADKLGIPIGTLTDLQGPEIRIIMPEAQTEMKKGELLLFGEAAMDKKEKGFTISHPDIIEHLKEGQKLLADDGAFNFHVVKKNGKTYLESDTDGILKTRKTLNIPGASFPFPVLVERDFEGLKLAAKGEVDFIALSFVRSAEDLQVMRKEMKKYSVDAKVVAKIETEKALNDLDNIIELSDAVMVARGDLGVELPIEQVPYYQKLIIKKCIEHGIPVITATQMLQSMVRNPYPSRAEISDIANATYDYTDAVMLSEEAAAGAYPLETVGYMARTVVFNEMKFDDDIRVKVSFKNADVGAMICDAAYNVYLRLTQKGEKIAGFIVYTQTGRTAKLISRYRPNLPIFAFAPNKKICESLTMNFGVYPEVLEVADKTEVTKEDIRKTVTLLQKKHGIAKDEKVIVLHGDFWAQSGGTSTVRVIEV